MKIAQNLFRPTERINTYKDKVNDYPYPRYYTTAQFYKNNNIKINTKSFRNLERAANLEESYKGKDVSNVNSTNIAEIMRQRKGKTLDEKNIVNTMISFGPEEQKQKIKNVEKLSKDKILINKNVIQETQMEE